MSMGDRLSTPKFTYWLRSFVLELLQCSFCPFFSIVNAKHSSWTWSLLSLFLPRERGSGMWVKKTLFLTIEISEHIFQIRTVKFLFTELCRRNLTKNSPAFSWITTLIKSLRSPSFCTDHIPGSHPPTRSTWTCTMKAMKIITMI